MKEEIFYRVVAGLAADAVGILRQVRDNTRTIMASQQEEADKLNQLAIQLDKANTEIQNAIQQLKDALAAAGGTTPEVDAATANLTAKAQALDDVVPDAPPAP